MTARGEAATVGSILAQVQGQAGARTLAAWAETIGPDAALKLSVEFGGLLLHIPRNPPPESKLVAVIGQAAATALGRRWGSGDYWVPAAAGRRAQVVSLRAAGKTIPEIARAINRSERYVYKVLRFFKKNGGVVKPAAPVEDPDQMNLF